MSFNLATMLRESALAAPDKPLVHAGGQSLTYAEVDQASGRVATSLLGLGLEPGGSTRATWPTATRTATSSSWTG